ncbi:hypothetical protein [Dialister invisus]|uniref:hypothetical protein n=1 Tax=Dialister invisus TaxID=218538 RepID=UPI002E7A8752|nr:hypothetical protein [Dialister invisus]MEE0504112.1 hypothetical protein [Dialister invisus]
MSDRALRDYAYRVLKSEYGERMENGILIPAKKGDEELAAFAAQMPEWQLEQMYGMMFKGELVE